MKRVSFILISTAAILLIAAALAAIFYEPPPSLSSEPRSLARHGSGPTNNGLAVIAKSPIREALSHRNSDIFTYFGDATHAELIGRAHVKLGGYDEIDVVQALESSLVNSPLDDSAACTIAEYLTVVSSQDISYLSWVSEILASIFRENGQLEESNAREIAYTTVIYKLLDTGKAEDAMGFARHALDSLPNSVPVQSALVTALSDLSYYDEAITILNGLRDSGDGAQAQLATLMYREGDTAQAIALASELRERDPITAEMMEEIPDCAPEVSVADQCYE